MPNYNTELKNLREQIDIIDDNICSWLALRVHLSQTIGHLKVDPPFFLSAGHYL